MTQNDRMIDDIDRTILTLLQRNARVPNAEIARQVGMAPSAVLERVRKLEERGLVMGYHARLDARQLGEGLVAFVFVRGEEPVGDVALGRKLAAVPSVQEVHHVDGEDCYLVKVRVRDTEALGGLLRSFGALPEVRSTRTTVVLGTLKEDDRVQLEQADD